MKILVTGATGYLGAVAADALASRGREVLGLARSQRSADALGERGIQPLMGDFGDPASLAKAVHESRPDVVVSTASVGRASGDHAAFTRDRGAVRAMREALADHGGALVFTSGSAVFGVFNGGDGTDTVYHEDTPCRFRHPCSRPRLQACTRCWPRVSATRWPLAPRPNRRFWPTAVCAASWCDPDWSTVAVAIPTSRHCSTGHGRPAAPGTGETAAPPRATCTSRISPSLFCLAAEHAPHGAILHGVVDDVTQRHSATAINRMIGAGEQTERLSLEQMLGVRADTVGTIGGSFTPPPSAASGISLSLNKRLSSEKTRKLLDWSPKRTDIWDDITVGSYAKHT